MSPGKSRGIAAIVSLVVVVALAAPNVLAWGPRPTALVSGKRLAKLAGKIVTVARHGRVLRRESKWYLGKLGVGAPTRTWPHPGRPEETPPPEQPAPDVPDPEQPAPEVPDPEVPDPEVPVPEPPTPPEPGPCKGTDVGPNANLAQTVSSAPAGATLCLSAGTYHTSTPIRLKNDMKLIGRGRESTFIKAGSAQVVIDAKGRNGIVLEGLDVSGANGVHSCRPRCGRGIVPGRNAVIHNVRVHHNQNNGIGGQGGGLVVTNSEIDHNGTPTFVGCCAGGIKAAWNYTIRNSYVHDNTGVGIWCDVRCGGGGGFRVYNNTVVNNSMGGIRYEISPGPAHISGNVVRNNNTSGRGGHGGIEINSSRNAVVENNRLGGNRGAGIIVSGSRAPGLGNITIRNNSLNGDKIAGCGGSISCGGNKN